MALPCPVCGGKNYSKWATSASIGRETALRNRFVDQRAPRRLSDSERKDLTEFAHGEISPLLSCECCGVLQRDERETRPLREYVEDDYDWEVLDHLLPRYVEAFRAKQQPYRRLLEEGADVLEIGSHIGAFLQVAKEWGWRPLGVDIGKDTSGYARAKGHTVFNHPIEECGFEPVRFDGVFVWNCFEQLPNPHPTLAEVHRVLRPGGILVVRTPNALFYRLCPRSTESGAADIEDLPVRALAYNNLLGFPYLYGYSSENLNALIERHGFRHEAGVNSELITVPLPDTPGWVEEDEQMVSQWLTDLSGQIAEQHPTLLAGPWIEMIYRKQKT